MNEAGSEVNERPSREGHDLKAASGKVEEAYARLAGELEQSRLQLTEADLQLDELAIRYSATRADAARWRSRAMEAEGALNAAQGMVEELRSSLTQQRDAIRQLQQQRSNERATETQAERAAAPAMLEQLPGLRREIRDLKNQLEAQASVEALMRQLASALSRPVKWWVGMLPQKVAHRIRLRELRRKAIFDADAYDRRYPDVGKEGMDPLQHYVLHGVDEGRRRM